MRRPRLPRCETRRQIAAVTGFLALWVQLLVLGAGLAPGRALAQAGQAETSICSQANTVSRDGGGPRTPAGHPVCACCYLGGCSAVGLPGPVAGLINVPSQHIRMRSEQAVDSPLPPVRFSSLQPRAPPIIA